MVPRTETRRWEWCSKVSPDWQGDGLGVIDRSNFYLLKKHRMIGLKFMGKKRKKWRVMKFWGVVWRGMREPGKATDSFSQREKLKDHMLSITLLDLFQLFLISIVCKWNKAFSLSYHSSTGQGSQLFFGGSLTFKQQTVSSNNYTRQKLFFSGTHSWKKHL